MNNNNCPTVSNPFSSDDHQNDLIIQMVASGKYLIFRDGIDSFNRSYNISWDSVSVYGRQDAIQTYQSTGETIGLDFPLKPGDNKDEFNAQLDALLALGKFARPLYSNGMIIESPILKIRYRNLIVEEYSDGNGTPLWIAPTSITINYGDRARNFAPSDSSKKLIVPKRISISLSAAVINVDKKYYEVETLTPKEEIPPTDEEQIQEIAAAAQLRARVQKFLNPGDT